MKIENVPIKNLMPYAANAKKHDKKQISNVEESIRQYGFVQPIVIDRDNIVIIGHCRLLAAKKLGMEKVPCICADNLTPEQVNALRIVDNKSNESPWDMDLLEEELADLDLSAFDFDWAFGINDNSSESSESNDYSENAAYTNATNIPQYEPTEESTALDSLIDKEKYQELLEQIKSSKLPEDEKDFLILAAARHIKFDYKKIANYYANASKEMQEQMEKSALVIIDYNNAIAGGYMKLYGKLKELIS